MKKVIDMPAKRHETIPDWHTISIYFKALKCHEIPKILSVFKQLSRRILEISEKV
jgi:hypothetical protein